MSIDNLKKFLEQTYCVSCSSITYVSQSETILYKAESSKGNFAVKVFAPMQGIDFDIFGEKTYTKENLEVINELIDSIQMNKENISFDLSTPIRSVLGTFSSRLSNGCLMTMSSWVEGSDLLHPMRSDSVFKQIGKCFAVFHKLATENAGNLNLQLQDRISSLLIELKKRIKSVICTDVLRNRLKNAYQIIQNSFYEHDCGNVIVVHGDASLSNIVEYAGRFSLIDYSLCSIANPYLDLGFLSFELPSDKVVDYLISGYEEESGMSINRDLLKVYRMFRALLYACANLKEAENFSWISEDPMNWVENLWNTVLFSE